MKQEEITLTIDGKELKAFEGAFDSANTAHLRRLLHYAVHQEGMGDYELLISGEELMQYDLELIDAVRVYLDLPNATWDELKDECVYDHIRQRFNSAIIEKKIPCFTTMITDYNDILNM